MQNPIDIGSQIALYHDYRDIVGGGFSVVIPVHPSNEIRIRNILIFIHIDGLAQAYIDSIANALDVLQSCYNKTQHIL